MDQYKNNLRAGFIRSVYPEFNLSTSVLVIPDARQLTLPPEPKESSWNVAVNIPGNSYIFTPVMGIQSIDSASHFSNNTRTIEVGCNSVKEMKAIRHNLCLSVFTGVVPRTDVRLSTCFTELGDPGDFLSPDLGFSVRDEVSGELRYIFIEFTTVNSDTTIEEKYQRKVEKYKNALEMRAAKDNIKTLYYVCCLGKKSLKTNLPNFSQSDLAMLSLLRQIGDDAYYTALGSGASFVTGVKKKHLEYVKESFKKAANDPEHRIPNRAEVKDELKDIMITTEFLAQLDDLNRYFDNHETEIYSNILKVTKDVTIEAVAKGLLEGPQEAIDAYMEKWRARGLRERKVKKLTTFHPVVPTAVVEMSVDHSKDPIVEGKDFLSRLFYQAFEARKSFPQRWEPYTAEALELIAQDQEAGLAKQKLNKERRNRRGMVDFTILPGQDRDFAFETGIGGKKFASDAAFEAKRRQKQLPLPPDTDTSMIDQFLDMGYQELLVKVDSECDAWRNKDNVELLKQMALAPLKRFEGKYTGTEVIDEFRKTRLWKWSSLSTLLFEELNVGIAKFCQHNQMVLRSVAPGMHVLYSSHGAGNEAKIFYSVMYEKSHFDKFESGIMREPAVETDSYMIFDFYSMEIDRFNYMVSFDLGLMIHHFASMIIWNNNSSWETQDFFRRSDGMRVAAMKCMILMTDKRDDSQTLFLLRHVFMELFGHSTITFSKPWKELEKFEPPRSLINLYTQVKYINFCRERDKHFAKVNAWEIKEDDPTTTQQSSNDKISGLEFFLLGVQINTPLKFLDACYFGHLKIKEASNYNQQIYKTPQAIMEIKKLYQKMDKKEICSFEFPLKKSFKKLESSAIILTAVGRAMRRQLDRKSSNHWFEKFWEKVSKMNEKNTLEKIATLKASLMAQNWEQQGYRFQPGKNHDETVKAAVAVVEEFLSDIQKRRELSPRICENFHWFLQRVKQVIIALTRKVQQGGDREISIMTIWARALQFIMEEIAGIVCEELDEEMISKGEGKTDYVQSFYTELYDKQEFCAKKDPDCSTKTAFMSGDATKFGPMQIFKNWAAVYKHILPDDVFRAFCSVWNLFINKIILIPSELMESFMKNMTKLYVSEVNTQLRQEFFGEKPAELLKGQGSYAVELPPGMQQGLFQRAASAISAGCAQFARELADSVVRASITDAKMEEMKKKNKEELELYTDKAEAHRLKLEAGVLEAAPNLTLTKLDDCVGLGIMDWLISTVVSSDDNLVQTAFIMSQPATQVHDLMIVYIWKIFDYIFSACGNQRGFPKTAYSFQPVGEFNSTWWWGRNGVYAAWVKFLNALRVLVPSGSLQSRCDQAATSLSACVENGVPFFMTNILQHIQLLFHYRMLGCNISEQFAEYSRKLANNCFHPALGAFLLQPQFCAGLLGFNFSYYLACRAILSTRTVDSFLLYSGLEQNSVSGGLANRLEITNSGREQFEKFKRRVDKAVGPFPFEDYISENARILYLPASTTTDTMVLTVLKTTKGSSALGFTNSSTRSVHKYVTYAGWAHIVSYLEKKVVEKQGVKKVEIERVKMSLIQVLDYIANKEKPVYNWEVVRDFRFPLRDTYDSIINVCQQVKDYNLVPTNNLSMRKIGLRLDILSFNRGVSLSDLAKYWWFSEKLDFTRLEIDSSTADWMAVFPWFNPKSRQQSLLDSPFEGEVEMANFITSQTERSVTVHAIGPVRHGLPSLLTLKALMCWSFMPGGVLKEGTRPPVERGLNEPEGFVGAPVEQLEQTILSNYNVLSLLMLGPNSDEKKKEYLEKLLKPKVSKYQELDVYDKGNNPRNKFLGMSYRSQIAALLSLYFNNRKDFIEHLLWQKRETWGYWAQIQQVKKQGNNFVWYGPGVWVGTVMGDKIAVFVFNDYITQITLESQNAFRNRDAIADFIGLSLRIDHCKFEKSIGVGSGQLKTMYNQQLKIFQNYDPRNIEGYCPVIIGDVKFDPDELGKTSIEMSITDNFIRFDQTVRIVSGLYGLKGKDPNTLVENTYRVLVLKHSFDANNYTQVTYHRQLLSEEYEDGKQRAIFPWVNNYTVVADQCLGYFINIMNNTARDSKSGLWFKNNFEAYVKQRQGVAGVFSSTVFAQNVEYLTEPFHANPEDIEALEAGLASEINTSFKVGADRIARNIEQLSNVTEGEEREAMVLMRDSIIDTKTESLKRSFASKEVKGVSNLLLVHPYFNQFYDYYFKLEGERTEKMLSAVMFSDIYEETPNTPLWQSLNYMYGNSVAERKSKVSYAVVGEAESRDIE